MLGELLYEAKGNVTGQRVLDGQGNLRIEVSHSDSIIFDNGLKAIEIVTHRSILVDDGALYAEGKGVIMTMGTETNESIGFTGYGLGKFSSNGGASFRGCRFHHRTPSSGKFDFLKNIVGVFEAETDGSGNVIVKVWKWR